LIEHVNNLEEPPGVSLPESDPRPLPPWEVIAGPAHHLFDLFLGDPVLIDVGSSESASMWNRSSTNEILPD
jgi:hypothetical protein